MIAISYFEVWWLGATLAAWHLHADASSIRWALGGTSGLASLSAIVVGWVGWCGPGVYPGLLLRHFASALFLALIAIAATRRLPRMELPFADAWRWLSSVSYGVYVLHYPLLITLPWSHTIVGFGASMVALVVLSIALDRKPQQWFSSRRGGAHRGRASSGVKIRDSAENRFLADVRDEIHTTL